MNIFVSNYINKPITFNKGEYIGCLEPTIEEIPQSRENPNVPTVHSFITERMIAENVVGHFQTTPS